MQALEPGTSGAFGSGEGAASGSGSGTGSGSGSGAPNPNDPTKNPVYNDPIASPELTLAERVAANYATLGPLFSPLGDSFAGGTGTQTVTIPARPTSTNWTPILILAAIGGGVWYWYKHRKKED